MANLSDIKKRVISVKSTRQITRTMEMVAATKIRPATRRIESATPYAEAMSQMLATLADNSDSISNPLFEEREEIKHVTFIVIVSDRGLAGGFNNNILRHVEKRLESYRSDGVEVSAITSGKKALPYLRARNVEIKESFIDISAEPTIAQARQIANIVIDDFENHKTDRVVMFYNHAKNPAEQHMHEEQIFPIDTSLVKAAKSSTQYTKSYEYDPSMQKVLDSLLPDYVITMIYRALLDSAAAEQGARRTAMKSATDNANEIIDVLQISYNRARQDEITTEITEIIGGAAALEDK